MAGLVGGGEGVRAGQEGTDDVGEVVAGELAALAALGEEGEEAAAQDAAEERPEDDVEGAGVEARGALGGDQDAGYGDHTAGNLEQRRLALSVAQAVDDDGLEGAHGAVGDRGRDGDEREEPGLRVAEGLPDLVGLEVLVLDAGLVLTETLDGGDFFGVREL